MVLLVVGHMRHRAFLEIIEPLRWWERRDTVGGFDKVGVWKSDKVLRLCWHDCEK
jgi:hypothetical protein